MKKFLLIGLLFFATGICIAQPGEWVWMHGPNTTNDPGVFGVQGVSSPANYPGSVYEPAEWTDQNGNFWLFGGVSTFALEYDDIWKYNPSINEWVWVKGSGTGFLLADYGTMGVPSPSNTPGGRGWGTPSCVDNSGNFWIFGGTNQASSSYSDLWRYEPSTNNWTWMKGPQGSTNPGVYGVQGVPDPANYPGGRDEVCAMWSDNSGNLWLFGGNQIGGCINDLWKYTISTNEWTWMKGSQFISATGVYGTEGVEDPANTPGARLTYSHWKDQNGNFWIYAGTNNLTNEFNDLWRYNPLTNNWAWFKGFSSSGKYGNKCVTDTANIPGARFENRACAEVNGNFWVFGGFNGITSNVYSDLWMYCVSTNQWTWISGDSTLNSAGNWGTIGVSSPTNHPGARGGNVMWADQSGHLYIFGGCDSGFPLKYNDLWKYTIDNSCAPCLALPVASFNAPNQICPGICIDFTNNSVGGNSFQWSFPGANPAFSTDSNPTNICYTTPGSYDVTLIATNGAGSDTLLILNYITVFPAPPPQTITQSGDTLFANPGAVSYQWYLNGSLITGATGSLYVATQSGNYNVVATDANNCEVEAVIFDVIANSSQLANSSWQLAIYPNPVKDVLEIRNLKAGSNISVIVYNSLGEKVLDEKKKNVIENISIDVSALSSGAYVIEIADGKTSARKIFTKE